MEVRDTAVMHIEAMDTEVREIENIDIEDRSIEVMMRGITGIGMDLDTAGNGVTIHHIIKK